MWWAGPEHSNKEGAARARPAPTWRGVAARSDAGSLKGGKACFAGG